MGGAATQGLMTCLSCEIEILQAKNVEFKSHGSLFVRYYLSTGNNKRAQLNSREISAKADLFWNESFSLQCSGNEDSINSLKQQTVVFELRWRSTNPILGKIAMRVRVPAMAEMEKTKRRNGRLKRWDDCGCCKDSGCRCEDYDIFFLVAALEAL
uniref:C2 domain-containing protein n=1 Tax=Salix viminalis TaxID=40686 RepID=A0A6N2LJ22_SALVM